MTRADPSTSSGLRDAVARVDVLDVAGAILANPERAMVSLAAKVALASALERCWAVCLEADLLVSALEQAMPWDRPADAEHAEHVALQMGAVRDLMTALRDGAPTKQQQEKADGND